MEIVLLIPILLVWHELSRIADSLEASSQEEACCSDDLEENKQA